MGEVRRVISLVLALTLTVGGLGLLFYLAAFAPVLSWRMMAAAALMATVGAYWLYEDFINATPNDQT